MSSKKNYLPIDPRVYVPPASDYQSLERSAIFYQDLFYSSAMIGSRINRQLIDNLKKILPSSEGRNKGILLKSLMILEKREEYNSHVVYEGVVWANVEGLRIWGEEFPYAIILPGPDTHEKLKSLNCKNPKIKKPLKEFYRGLQIGENQDGKYIYISWVGSFILCKTKEMRETKFKALQSLGFESNVSYSSKEAYKYATKVILDGVKKLGLKKKLWKK